MASAALQFVAPNQPWLTAYITKWHVILTEVSNPVACTTGICTHISVYTYHVTLHSSKNHSLKR